MAIRGGYYNSLNGDRKYNAETMSSYFAGLYTRGVLQNFKNKFVVKADEGLKVIVPTGKAYFQDGKWIENTADIVFTLDPADVMLNRIDSIVLVNNKKQEMRKPDIVLKKGTPATNPIAPGISEADKDIEEMLICNISIPKLTETITQANIENTIPNSDVCGYVTGLIEQVDTSDLYLQYETAYKEFQTESKKEFDEWFKNVKETLSTATLIREYTRTYTTLTDGEKEIYINIPQYNSVLDILEVYVNGFRLNDNQYTSDNMEFVTLKLPVDAGTEIQFAVYKSVDGSEAETIIGQVEKLQKDVYELNKYVYYATGENDNIALSKLAHDFYNARGIFSGIEENARAEIRVVGTLGVSDKYAGTGTTQDPHRFFDFDRGESTRKLVLDFTNTNRLSLQGVNGNVCVAFYGNGFEAKGIKAVLFQGSELIGFKGENIKIQDAEIYINGTATEVPKGVTGSGTFKNVRISVTGLNAKATGVVVNNTGIVKLYDCEILVYNATNESTESIGVLVEANQTEAVLIMQGCNIPLRARNGYKQSQTIKVNSGYCSLTSNTVGKSPAIYSTDPAKCTNVGTLVISK